MATTQPSDDAVRQLLIERFESRGRVYRRLAYGIVRCRESACDLCQETFMTAWAKRRTIHDWQGIDQWLITALIHACLAHSRSQQSQTRRIHGRAALSLDSWDPIELVAIRDEAIFALDQLPQDLRPVVALRLIQGMSGNEVSELLGLSAKQVSQRLHRGLEIMRKRLFDNRNEADVREACRRRQRGRPS